MLSTATFNCQSRRQTSTPVWFLCCNKACCSPQPGCTVTRGRFSTPQTATASSVDRTERPTRKYQARTDIWWETNRKMFCKRGQLVPTAPSLVNTILTDAFILSNFSRGEFENAVFEYFNLDTWWLHALEAKSSYQSLPYLCNHHIMN